MAVVRPRAWLVAAENGALPGGKVGGVGDVIRDLPPALARAGWPVRVIVPSYGVFHRLPGAERIARIAGRFAGAPFEATAWRLPGAVDGVEQVTIDHSLLCPGQPGVIYERDPEDRPFETDSGKFAFFCTAVAAWLASADESPEVVHLHDWHTGLLPFLCRAPDVAEPPYAGRMVFTIHNLAYQGVRPLREAPASMERWFPGRFDGVDGDALLDPVRDPARPDLVNFMAAALREADAVATVSPTYAREILRPSDPARGFHGGEGLEGLLNQIAADERLSGILNGCEYPPSPPATRWDELVAALREETRLYDRLPELRRRIVGLGAKRPDTVMLAIGRVVPQKVALFLEPVDGHATALDAILERLGEEGVFLMLGNGDRRLEGRLRAVSERHENFLYLCGYAEALSDLLYRAADLFLMPSSFEPCGISQMLALRAGQPCVVHGVGGLRDTVEDGVTGFVFGGESPAAQGAGFVMAVSRALDLRRRDPDAWRAMSDAAAAQRFSWDRAAARTASLLYAPEPGRDRG